MAGLSATAMAQTPPKLPPQVEPGRPPQPAPAPAEVPQADFDFQIQAPRATGEPQALDELTFPVSDVIIDGMTVFPIADFQKQIDEVKGKNVGLSAITKIAQEIEARYKAAGYVLSRAFVPPQRTGTGVFHITVLEGFIKGVSVENASPEVQAQIEAYLRPLVNVKPIALPALERALLLASDLPGVAASGILRPGDEVGSTELVVTVVETTIDGVVTGTNRGSKYAGPFSTFGVINYNGYLGLNEQISLGASLTLPHTAEQRYLSGRYQQPIGEQGLVASVESLYSVGQPGFNLKPFDIKTHSFKIGPRLAYPVIRSRSENLTVDGGLSYQQSTSTSLGQLLTRDIYPSMDARVNYTAADVLNGSFGAVVDVSHGFQGLGARGTGAPDLSRAKASPNFTKITADVRRIQPLFGPVSLSANFLAQYSMTPLYAGEEFSLGGSRIGRGYDPSEISGRDGYGGALELRFDSSDLTFMQPYVFYDYGTVYTHQPSDRTPSLASAGAGVRFTVLGDYTATVEAAQPLTRAPSTENGRRPLRILFDFAARF